MTLPNLALLSARAATGTTFVPTDITGCQGWWDATDASSFTLSGSTVTAWNDISGNSRNMTAVAGSPTRDATINGVTAVNFTPSARMRTTDPAVTQYTTNTIFAVVESDSVTGNRNILGPGYSAGTTTLGTSGTTLQVYAGTVRTGGTVATGTPYIFQSTMVASTSSAGRISGGASVLSGSPGAGGARGFSLGSYQYALTDNWDGRIGEVIFYDSALSLTDINTVGEYLETKWGITWTTAT